MTEESVGSSDPKRETTTKRCPRCESEKSLESFYLHAKNGHQGWCKACVRTYNKARYPEKGVWQHLARQYGVSRERYFELLDQQGGLCAICRCKLGSVRAKQPDVDHDHTTGRVRGLLCRQCNVSLGLLKESPERCRAMAVYLEAGGFVADDIVRPVEESAAGASEAPATE